MAQTGTVPLTTASNSQRTVKRLAWSIEVFSVAIAMIGLAMALLGILASKGEFSLFSHLFFFPIATFVYGVFGALVASRHPHNPIGWLLCAVATFTSLMIFAAGWRLFDRYMMPDASLPFGEFIEWLSVWTWVIPGLIPFTFLLLLFPDGRLLSARWRSVAWAAGLGVVGTTLGIAYGPDGQDAVWPNPYALTDAAAALEVIGAVAGILLLIGFLGSVASVVIRFRRSKGIERAQLKWLAYAGVMMVAILVVGSIVFALWPESLTTNAVNDTFSELSIIIVHLLITSVIVAIGVAILRYRLWDIDIIINRTLVYLALTTAIVSLYVLIVGALGTMLQTGGNLPVSLVATGLIAVSFQPLRERLQQAVNRLMFGKRDDPYAVLSQLGQSLEAAVAPHTVLPAIAETVAQALKLPYVAIQLDDEPVPVTWGRPVAGAMAFPLVYQTEAIGRLLAAPRGRGEALSPADQRLLQTIARQAGPAVHAVRLTADLQRSRQRLVATREEERRRLRRDLHDGLGPTLAAHALKIGSVRAMLSGQPANADKILAELETDTDAALADIRRLVHNLRPPALDQLGLVGAIHDCVSQLSTQSNDDRVAMCVAAPEALPALPAAVEVAAYRIAQEGLTNVHRHARARQCDVSLRLTDETLQLTIEDDGVGVLPGYRAGVGLSSMRERAEELGGQFTIQSIAGKGTTISACLPLRQETG